MLKNHIPFISKLQAAFRTKNAFKHDNEISNLADWEQVKIGNLPAHETAATLLTAAAVPASVAAAILFQVEYYDDFKQAFVNTRYVLMGLFVPFIIYMSAYFSAKYATPKDARETGLITQRTNYCLLLTSQKFFWPTLITNLGLVLFFYMGPRSAPSELAQIFGLIALAISAVFAVYLVVFSLYFFYYQIPKKYFSEDALPTGAKKHVVYTLKYLATIFTISIAVQLFILGASAAWAGLLTCLTGACS